MTQDSSADTEKRNSTYFSDPAIALFLAISSLLIATAFLVIWVPLDGTRNYYQHGFFGPAAMQACGRGLAMPQQGVCPELDAFLSGKADSFDPAALPEDFVAQGLDSYGLMHWHLLWTVGTTWRLCGISWKALTLVSLLLYAMTGLSAYGLFRLGIGRALSAVATLTLLLSPAVLCWLPNLRDFSKAPFFLAAMWVMGLLIKRPLGWRSLFLHSAALGAIAGIGLGFRTDLLICILPGLVVLSLFTRVECARSVLVRVAAACIFLVAFAIPATPVLYKMHNDRGGEAAHNIMGGFASGCFTMLGVEPASYEIMHMLDDREIHCTVTSYGIRAFGKQDKYGFMAGFSATSGKSLIRQLGLTFPYDLIVRGYGGTLWALGGAQADTPCFPDPFVRSLADIVRPIIVYLDASKVWLTAMALLFLAAVNARFAWTALFAMLYFGGYTTLQFDVRHAFHLCVLGYWSAAFVLDTLLVQPLVSKERRRRIGRVLGAVSTELPPISRRMLFFALPALAMLTVPAGLAWLYQTHAVNHYRDNLFDVALTEIPTHSETINEGVLVAPESLLPGHLPADTPADSVGGQWAVQTAYVALRFRSCAGPFSLTAQFEAADDTSGLTRVLPIRTVDTRPGAATTIFIPIHQMADALPAPDLAPGETGPVGWSRFLGIAMSDEVFKTFEGMYCAEDCSKFPLLLTVTLPESPGAFLPYRPFAPRFATFNRQFNRAIEGRDLESAAIYSQRLVDISTYDRPTWIANATETLFRLGGEWENVLPENMGAFDAIENVYREALALSPRDDAIRNVLANLLLKKARCILENAAKQDGKLDSEQFDLGVRNCREAVELMPYGYPAYEELSDLYIQNNDLPGLEREWRDKVHAHPEYMLTHFNHGLALERLGKLDLALDAYRKALELQPDADGTKEALARTLNKKATGDFEAGKIAESASLLEESLALRPENEQVKTEFAKCLMELGDTLRATVVLRELIQSQPYVYQPYEILSDIYIRAGDLTGLESEWREQTKSYPERMLAHFCLGLAYEREGKIEEALGAYRTALEIDPGKTGTKEALARSLWKHAKELRTRSETENALNELLEANQLSPGHAHVLTELGLTLVELQRGGEAMEHFRQAIELIPTDYAPYEGLSAVYVQAGDLAGLLGEWEAAAQAHPDRMLTHFCLGLAHERLGQYDEALIAYRAALTLAPDAQGTLQAIARAEKALPERK